MNSSRSKARVKLPNEENSMRLLIYFYSTFATTHHRYALSTDNTKNLGTDMHFPQTTQKTRAEKRLHVIIGHSKVSVVMPHYRVHVFFSITEP